MLPAPLKFLNLSRMQERSQTLIEQKEKDDATMNFVSKQAQEAILDPNVTEYYKHHIVRAAVDALWRIAERRSTYDARHSERQGLEQSRTIYDAEDDHSSFDGNKGSEL